MSSGTNIILMSKFDTDSITAVTFNWMQARTTLGAVRNFRHWYPDIPLLVIDAGDEKEGMDSFDKIYGPMDIGLMLDKDIDKLRLAQTELNFRLIEVGENLSHGSLADYAVWESKTPLLLTMDNDIRLLDGRLLGEYLDKMNEDDDLYAVGSVYHTDSLSSDWVGLWFSLFKLEPIKKYHLTFGSYVIKTIENKPVFLETGAFVYHALSDKYLHRTVKRDWKAYRYPKVEAMDDRLIHLKVRNGNYEQRKEWLKYVDGVTW